MDRDIGCVWVSQLWFNVDWVPLRRMGGFVVSRTEAQIVQIPRHGASGGEGFAQQGQRTEGHKKEPRFHFQPPRM